MTSKWKWKFVDQFQNTAIVKRLTEEINHSIDKKREQKQVDKDLRDVLRGKYKRKGK